MHEPGDNTRLAVLQEGAVLDEMSMPDGELRFASCGALSELEAAVNRAASDLGSSSRGRQRLFKLTKLLAQRLRNTSSQRVKALQKQ